VLHRDGPIVECRANVFILSQTLEAVKRGLLAVHTFTCCPILVATGPPSPACDMLMEGGGGAVRSKCHFVFFLQNKGPRKSTSLHHFTLSTYRGADKSLARLLPDVFCLMVRIFHFMLVLLYT
jgi:hypothetical protein